MSVPPAPAAPSTADVVAAAVLAVPGVAGLDGGPFGTVASLLPGRRVIGVRIPEGAGTDGVAHDGGVAPVEVAVVVTYGVALPALADEVAAAVRGVLGAVQVDVTFADVVDGPA